MTSGDHAGTIVPAQRPSLIRRLATAIAVAGLILAALAPAASAGKLEYGIVPQDGALPSASDLDMMPGGGIDSLRMMIPWGLVEQSPGTYDWSQTDAMVRELIQRGITAYPFLYGTPSWAAQKDHRQCSGGDCAVYPPKSPPMRRAFADFAGAAAARYGVDGDFWKPPSTTSTLGIDSATADDPPPTSDDSCPIPLLCPPPPPPPPPPTEPPLPTEPPCGCTQPQPITTWQIWNEQNSPKYFAPKAKPNLYAKIVRESSAAIRAADPGAEIILGGMWGPESAKDVVMPVTEYFEGFYGVKGISKSFDSIAIHPYARDAQESIDELEEARLAVKQAGDRDAGLWVSEIGWAAGGPKSNPYVKGLDGQARILTRALTTYQRKQRSLHLRGVFWYSWRDKKGGDLICEWCGHAGLMAKDGSEKPAWKAFTRIARG